jgi:hypothetical protein
MKFRSLITPTLIGFIQRPPSTRKVGEVNIATKVHYEELCVHASNPKELDHGYWIAHILKLALDEGAHEKKII